ncbi:MAG: hypothetical protein HeimC3_00180 [Candidatus Heimdallarchaeota archaeon LC_3]|nr:MAG: hypothetical protein HeimC3_00180 [Candidatus Heimdallarchaeota archaeon LC_3]
MFSSIPLEIMRSRPLNLWRILLMSKSLLSYVKKVDYLDMFESQLKEIRQSKVNISEIYDKIIQLEESLLKKYGVIPSFAQELSELKTTIGQELDNKKDLATLTISLDNFKILAKFIKSLSLLDEYKILLEINPDQVNFTILDSSERYFFQTSIDKSFFNCYNTPHSYYYIVTLSEFKTILERIPQNNKNFYSFSFIGSDQGLFIHYELIYNHGPQPDLLKIKVNTNCLVIKKDSEEIQKILKMENRFKPGSKDFIQKIGFSKTEILYNFLSYCNSFKNDYYDFISINVSFPKTLTLSDMKDPTDVSTTQEYSIETLTDKEITAEYYQSYFKFMGNIGLIFLTKSGKKITNRLENYNIYFDKDNNLKLDFITNYFSGEFIIAPNIIDNEDDLEDNSQEEAVQILNSDIKEEGDSN